MPPSYHLVFSYGQDIATGPRPVHDDLPMEFPRINDWLQAVGFQACGQPPMEGLHPVCDCQWVLPCESDWEHPWGRNCEHLQPVHKATNSKVDQRICAEGMQVCSQKVGIPLIWSICLYIYVVIHVFVFHIVFVCNLWFCHLEQSIVNWHSMSNSNSRIHRLSIMVTYPHTQHRSKHEEDVNITVSESTQIDAEEWWNHVAAFS